MIYLAFTDDWELRGDGSGDIERIQFEPMRRLLDIFEKHRMRSTFMAEVMQQLTFRNVQERFPELRLLADRWDDHVRDAYRRGHDVQLHLHTQWSEAVYENGEWRLGGSWSILNYSQEDAARMIAQGKAYLEKVLRAVDPDYRCIAFRASYLAAAPSPTLLDELAARGLEIESSLVGGLRVDTDDVRFDYTVCEEDFEPFYPQMTDARCISAKREPMVCVPIFNFTGSRISAIRQIGAKAGSKMNAVRSGGAYSPIEASGTRSSIPARVYDKVVRPVLFGKQLTADVSNLDLPLLREMLSAIRSRARASRRAQVPVVITNHSKNMADFDGFDQFLGVVAATDDVRTITMTQLASMLRAGDFTIGTKS